MTLTVSHSLSKKLLACSKQIKDQAKSGQLDIEQLLNLANWEARLALAVKPRPVNPIKHLEYAHQQARLHLSRLLKHDPTREIAASDDGYVYTPRKVLRRVLDHALDHLHQIEQWLVWQPPGIEPKPTDCFKNCYQLWKRDCQQKWHSMVAG